MRHTTALWMICLSGLAACSGKYETRSHPAAGGSPGDGVTDTNGLGASATSGASNPDIGGNGLMAVGGSVAGGLPEPPELPQCGLSPQEWSGGQLARADVIWQRFSPLIWGAAHEAPAGFENIPNIAANLEGAIDEAIAQTGGIPGAQLFVERWTAIEEPTGPFLARWPVLLGLSVPAAEVLLGIDLDEQRISVFTEPNFLRAYPTISRRGYVMVRALFGTDVPAEPPGVPPFEPPPGLTRREALDLAVSQAPCQPCHTLFDPLGYSLENYDAAGDFVTLDAGKPVDASGTLEFTGATNLRQPIPFRNVLELAPKLAKECAVNFGLADEFLRIAVSEMGVAEPGAVITDQDRQVMRSAFLSSPSRSYRALVLAFAHTRLALSLTP